MHGRRRMDVARVMMVVDGVMAGIGSWRML